MAGKGGYQAPNKPAVQSGPGAMSQRTDGGPASKQAVKQMTGMPYGENQDFNNLESSAPMAKAVEAKPLPPSAIDSAAQDRTVIPLHAPTQRPNEPVTTGAPIGPGAGPEALGLSNQPDDNFRANLAMYMPALSFIAGRSETSPETRAVIRQLRDML
jgi:hypothetical protein